MRLSLPLFTILCCVAIPVSQAEEADVWNFAEGNNMPLSSELTTVQRTPQGIHVQTSTDGFLYWDTPFLHPIDVLSLHMYTPKNVIMGLLWHGGKSNDTQYSLDVFAPGKDSLQDVSINVRDNKQWNWMTDQVAIGIPAGSDIVIQSIVVRRFSTTEKLTEAFRSFWTFDDFRAYSINFLWGPLLAFNPVARATLYDQLPPPSWSADRLFYLLIGASILIGLAFFLYDRTHGKKTALMIITATFIGIWILFDVRMGAEIISYGVDDVTSYVLPPDHQKTFRTHLKSYTNIDTLLPVILSYDRYILYAPEPSPYYANLRYIGYPSIPVRPNQNAAGVKLFVVMDRPDITVRNGHLVDGNGGVLTTTGSVLQTIDDSTFLFATP